MGAEIQPPRKFNFIFEVEATVRRYVLRGALLVIPTGVTFYVLVLIYRFTGGLLAPSLRPYAGEAPQYVVAAVSILLFLAILYCTGVAANLVVGRRVIGLGEAVLRRIPLVKTIYAGSRQAVDVLSRQGEANTYQASVLVPFPSSATRAVGFVTGIIDIKGGEPLTCVFVPTTPNPTSGYLELYPRETIEYTTMTVEDGVRAIMSAGIMTPDEIRPIEVMSPSTPAMAAAPRGAAPVRRKRFAHAIRRRLISGFLVLVPLGITIFILRFVYGLTAGNIEPLTVLIGGDLPPYMNVVVSVVLLIILLYLVGYIATAVVVGRLIHAAESLLDRIPLVKTVYAATKQIVVALVETGDKPKFQAPVLVPFPDRGAKTVGFMVGTVIGTEGRRLIKVFIPTAPNITVGFLVIYEIQDVTGCSITIEDAIKMVVSAGIVCPDSMVLTPITKVMGAVA